MVAIKDRSLKLIGSNKPNWCVNKLAVRFKTYSDD